MNDERLFNFHTSPLPAQSICIQVSSSASPSKLDADHGSLCNVSASNTLTSQRVRKRLQIYKTGYEKAIARETNVLNDYLGLQGHAMKFQTDLINSMTKRGKEYRQCRRDTNRSRLVYYKMLANWQAHIIDELDKLVRNFKNVAMPKVKGVSLSKGNIHGLTGPLERMASGLKNAYMITKRQIGLAEKFVVILRVDMKEVADMFERVGKAEEMLESDGEGL
jgi:hypothetical protein